MLNIIRVGEINTIITIIDCYYHYYNRKIYNISKEKYKVVSFFFFTIHKSAGVRS